MRLARLLRIAGGALLLILLSLVGCVQWLTPPSLSPPSPATLSLEGVTLAIPGESRRPGLRIALEDGHIAAIDASEGPDEGEWQGHTVTPGLVDAHVHYAPGFVPGGRALFGTLFLRYGVTRVRDVGSFAGDALVAAEAIRDGKAVGPKIQSCGPFVDGHESQWPGSLHLTDLGERDAPDAVLDELAQRGASCIKLYNALEAGQVDALIRGAGARGMRAVAHVSDRAGLENYQGAELQHFMRLVPSWIGLRDVDIAGAVERSRVLRLEHTPTLVSFAMHAAALRGEGLPRAGASRFLPSFLRERLWRREHNPVIDFMLGDSSAHAHARVDAMARLLVAMRQAELPLFLGSDTPNPGVVPGESLQREMELWARLGFSPEEVFERATRGAAAALGDDTLGRVEVGQVADLLVFAEDPTRDLGALKSLRAVVAQGRLYRVEDLDRALEAMRRHFESPLYRALSETAVSRALDVPGLIGRSQPPG